MGSYEDSPPAVQTRYRDWWNDHAGERFLWFERDLAWRIARWRKISGLSVCELGCGTGSASLVLARAGARLVALEPEPLSIAVANQRLQDYGAKENAVFIQTEYIGQSSACLPIKDETQDLVIMTGVLEHMTGPERKACVSEAFRILRPGGGVFVFDTPNRVYPYDHHTTLLWFVGWAPERLAEKYAVFRKRFDREKDFRRQGGVGISRRRLDRLFPQSRWKTVYERDLSEAEDGFRRLADYSPLVPGFCKGAASAFLGAAGKGIVHAMKAIGMNPFALSHAHAVMFEKISDSRPETEPL